MTSSDDLAELLYSEFAKAEKAVKDYEHLAAELPVPSINELRYAGFHAVQAIKLGISEHDKCHELLDRAIRHSRRAYYDVLEYDVMLMTKKVEAYQRVYEGYEYLAASIIPGYIDHIKKLNALGELLGSAHELDKESPVYIDGCGEQISVMRNFINDFLSAQEPLYAAIAHEQKSSHISWIQCIIGIVASFVLGIIVSFIF
ncbi:MAG: hypothetical protein RR719_07100 [Akkermansia sp.]